MTFCFAGAIYEHLGAQPPEKCNNPRNDFAVAIFYLALTDLRQCQKLYSGTSPEFTDHDRACDYIQRPTPKILLTEGLKQMYYGVLEKLNSTPKAERLAVLEAFRTVFVQAKLVDSELLLWQNPEAMLAAFTIFRYLAQNNGEDPIAEWKKLENLAGKTGSRTKG